MSGTGSASLTVHAGRLRLEPYRPADCRELYAVRYHPTVRRFMARPALASYESHRAWTRSQLANGGPLRLWLVRHADHPRAIGFTQLRFDPSGDSAEIGVMFREPARHTQAATVVGALTLHLAFVELGCRELRSYVIEGHPRALAFNRAGGAVEVPSDRPGLVRLRMAREVCLTHPNFLKVMARYRLRGLRVVCAAE
jgi:RimJ/RimL family protein N-acetyltransferase